MVPAHENSAQSDELSLSHTHSLTHTLSFYFSFIHTLSLSHTHSLSLSQVAKAEEEGQGVRSVDSEEARVLRGALADGVAALGELSRVGGSTHTAAVLPLSLMRYSAPHCCGTPPTHYCGALPPHCCGTPPSHCCGTPPLTEARTLLRYH